MSFSVWLAAVYREIAERAGLDAALRLARARGGQRISVPSKPNGAPWLIEAMGAEGAKALCDLYGGAMLDLPADPVGGEGQKARVRRVKQAILDGKSANEIAAAHDITRRAVFFTKAKMKARDAEPDLFSLADASKANERARVGRVEQSGLSRQPTKR